ncbi:iron complex transport system permease protein [Methanococcus voltae]|uniref:FecCD family ABC transporter permease n=1 Tax=Methanococcus voltae TaxID=2188 RepID=UPI001AE8B1BE|nr:iron ABC transporter permease [Methanococcus voltae]MBP2143335.1 iron complex transport system permease protein [Methanococcus voltae]
MKIPENDSILEHYKENNKKESAIFIAGLLLLFLTVLYSATVGSADISPITVFYSILSKFMPLANVDEFANSMIWNLRLPRIILGVIAGAGFAIAGSSMQGITRNPLVSPFTIGISAAAAFGASLSIYFGISHLAGGYIIVLFAFIAALACAAVVFKLASLKQMTVSSIILSGIALNYFFSALTSTLHFSADEQQLAVMVHWTFGSLSNIAWGDIQFIAIVFAICTPILLKKSWDITSISILGDDTAKTMGINTKNTRKIVFLISTFLTSAIVCFTGIIGFVCLVAPHITRYLIGGDYRKVLPFSCVIGALLLLLADTFGRTIFSPVIIPVGIVLSFVGVPLFIILMIKNSEEYW